MNSTCNDAGLQNILVVANNIMNILFIVVPIITILSLTIAFVKAAMDPEDKKIFPRLRNILIACAIIFIIPVFVNIVMSMLGEDSDISICWRNAKMSNPNSSYHNLDNGRKKRGVLDDPDSYEKGIKKPNPTMNNNNVKYGSTSLNVKKYIGTNTNNPSSGLGDGRNRYRAVQNAVYTGRFAVYAQNRNYGGIDASSKGGRICWSDMQTRQMVACVEVGAEGGHMDGLAYDNDRGLVLKTGHGRLLLYDNKTFKLVGSSGIDSTYVGMVYVPAIHMLVGQGGNSFIFYKYNSSNNKYERHHSVNLQNFGDPAVQGLGTDGTNIFVAVSSPYNNEKYLSTYSLNGQLLERNTFDGGGFDSIGGTEVEAAFGDNEGHLYLASTQGIGIVTNKIVNKVGVG